MAEKKPTGLRGNRAGNRRDGKAVGGGRGAETKLPHPTRPNLQTNSKMAEKNQPDFAAIAEEIIETVKQLEEAEGPRPKIIEKVRLVEEQEGPRPNDRDPNKAIIASAFKLLGNSSYGRSLMRKDRHHDVKFVDGRDAKAAINSPYFVDLTALEDSGFYEAKLRKKSVTVDLPIQIGIFVYGYAKLKLLQFYYEFLDFYLDRADFQAVTCDTDSIYIALSHSTLGEAVKPHLKQHFSQHRSQWLPTLYCAEHQAQSEENSDGLPTLPCCQAAHRHQMREPGLWKMEAKADRIIALAPKTYICSGQEGVKVSCKGVQKRINPMTTDNFKTVLTTQQSSSVVNRGFRLNSLNQMCSYIQPKTGLSYLYIKRKVLDDGVSTVPLTL
ncbi:hypothetical protein BaRGS_00038835 [Batillaria attramentaria]|uniref:DNA-directed DNA polymerase n=1 Tax=Batillaria attramentaria TaxID=370345 RepID=A0ABD0J4Q7_9CAEN